MSEKMKVTIATLGCKVNQYESDAMLELFLQAGFESVKTPKEADVFVLNSCTVTAVGDAKTRKLLRRVRGEHPGMCIVLTGCFPQAFPEQAKALDAPDIITGTKDRSALPEKVKSWFRENRRQVEISTLDFHGEEAFEALGGGIPAQRTRAFLKIQDGCARFCAYCIIPTARGPVRSRLPQDIALQAKNAVDKGFRELVLVGINLSCYGTDLGCSLFDGVAAAAVEGIERIRLGSLEPELLTPENIGRLAQTKVLCPQFHLSLQSGCDRTLRRMNRHYTTDEYREIVKNLRATFENCAITTDIMVGFPGESPQDFAESLRFCQEIGFAKAHVFPYSVRPGTAAAKMPDLISKEEKTSRAKQMTDVTEASRRRFFAGQVGKTAVFLPETEHSPHVWQGYTENYTPLLVTCENAHSGISMQVKITDAEEEHCIGIPFRLDE